MRTESQHCFVRSSINFLFYQPGQCNCCRQEGGDSTYDYCCPESYSFVQLKVALVFQCYTTILSFNPVMIILGVEFEVDWNGSI